MDSLLCEEQIDEWIEKRTSSEAMLKTPADFKRRNADVAQISGLTLQPTYRKLQELLARETPKFVVVEDSFGIDENKEYYERHQLVFHNSSRKRGSQWWRKHHVLPPHWNGMDADVLWSPQIFLCSLTPKPRKAFYPTREDADYPYRVHLPGVPFNFGFVKMLHPLSQTETLPMLELAAPLRQLPQNIAIEDSVARHFEHLIRHFYRNCYDKHYHAIQSRVIFNALHLWAGLMAEFETVVYPNNWIDMLQVVCFYLSVNAEHTDVETKVGDEGYFIPVIFEVRHFTHFFPEVHPLGFQALKLYVLNRYNWCVVLLDNPVDAALADTEFVEELYGYFSRDDHLNATAADLAKVLKCMLGHKIVDTSLWILERHLLQPALFPRIHGKPTSLSHYAKLLHRGLKGDQRVVYIRNLLRDYARTHYPLRPLSPT